MWTFVILMAFAAALAGCAASDSVAAGTGTLALTLNLPEGYHLNELTTSLVTWELDGAVVKTDAALKTSVESLDEPVRLPVTFAAGESSVTAHLNIRYCTNDVSRCIVENQDLQFPVHVAANGSRDVLAAEYRIVPPTS